MESNISCIYNTYNSSTGKITATGFVGTLTGNVTGNVTGSSGSCTGNALTATTATTVSVATTVTILDNEETDENNCLSIYNHFTVANQFNIQQLYPNPFNPVLNITFDIAWSRVIRVDILDISGNHIKTLHSGFLKFGSHELSWNAESMPSGLYFVSLWAGGNSLTSKVVLLK